LGLVIASWLTSVLAGFLPYDAIATAIQTQPDWRIVGFTAALTVLTALFFGLPPAVQSTRADLAPTLKNEAASASLARGQTRLRQVLVCAQVALSLVLLFAAGLFGKSLHELLAVNMGVKVSHVVQFSIDPSLHKYSPRRSRQLFEDLQDKIRHLPGVLSASAVSVPVLGGEHWQSTVDVEGYQHRQGEDMNPGFNETLPGLFSNLGVPLLAGRDFNERDIAGAPLVAIVNQTFVRRYVHEGRALGLHFGLGGQKAPMLYEIVGVVPDVKGGDLKEEPKPYTYMPLLQDEKPSAVTYYVRTVQDSMAVVPEVRRKLRELDVSLPMNDVKTLSKQIDQTQFIDRLFALLSKAFGVLAMLLAAIGLYGVTSYSVVRRTREIGIRVALGAEQAKVFRMVMREVMALTAFGLLVGAPLVYWAGRIAASQIFEVRPTDPWVLMGAVLTILGVSVTAGALPARRATRVDPLEALRHE
jgi:predicted permease